MLLHFRKNIAWIFLLVIAFMGCKKDGQKSTTGTIVGKVTPAGSAVNVVATLPNNTGYVVIPDANGDFKFEKVLPGTYSVVANPSSGYTYGVPVVVDAHVTEGSNFPVGTFALLQDNTGEVVTYGFDGENYAVFRPSLQCTYDGHNFFVSGQAGPDNSDHVTVTISLLNVLDPSIYTTGNTINSSIRIIKYEGSNTYTWSTIAGGLGTIKITDLNTVTHRITGTFAVDAVPENSGTTGNKSIANGAFVNLFFP